MSRRLVLASTSRWRRAQLESLGLRFDCVAPGVDEEAVGAGAPDPRALVARLAEAKARAVAADAGDSLVIGADQVGEIDGVVLQKPGTAARALEQLGRLSGREHRLWTGVCVVDGATGEARAEVAEVRLTMRALPESVLRAYVAADSPLDCAGSYRFESRGAALFERVEAADPTAIVGLPLLVLTRLLVASGYDPLVEGGA